MELPKPPQGNYVIFSARRHRHVLGILIWKSCRYALERSFKTHCVLVREFV